MVEVYSKSLCRTAIMVTVSDVVGARQHQLLMFSSFRSFARPMLADYYCYT